MIFRQRFGGDLVRVRIGRAEVCEIKRLSIDKRAVIVDPTFQRRQILSPIKRAVDQVFVTAIWPAGELIEVGEIIRPDGKRFADLPTQKNRSGGNENRAAIRVQE